jgi:hypothetical protein
MRGPDQDSAELIDALNERLTSLESRMIEQDRTIRHTLTMLIEWVGRGRQPPRRSLNIGDREAVAQAQPINGMSVDVEDWFQVGAFETVIDKDNWDSLATGSSAIAT